MLIKSLEPVSKCKDKQKSLFKPVGFTQHFLQYKHCLCRALDRWILCVSKTTLISLSLPSPLHFLVVGLDSRNKQGVDDGFVTVSLKTEKGMDGVSIWMKSFSSCKDAPLENEKQENPKELPMLRFLDGLSLHFWVISWQQARRAHRTTEITWGCGAKRINPKLKTQRTCPNWIRYCCCRLLFH